MNSNFEKISLETLALVALETEVNIGKLKGFKVHRLNNNDIRCLEIPRNLIRSIKNEKNINNSGIYFLINDDNNSLYVGQATDILNRLTDHNREEKDFTKAKRLQQLQGREDTTASVPYERISQCLARERETRHRRKTNKERETWVCIL